MRSSQRRRINDVLNLGNASTQWTSSFDGMPLKKEVDPNKMPKTLMSLNGQQKPTRGKKSRGKPSQTFARLYHEPH